MSDDQKNDKEKRPPPRFIMEMAQDISKELKDTRPPPKIIIEYHIHIPNMMTFNVNRSICLLQAAFSYVPFGDEFKKILANHVGPLGEELCLALVSILGIDRITIEPYRFTLTKGMAFSWKDIQPAVLDNIDLIVFRDRSQTKIKRLGSPKTIIGRITYSNPITEVNEEGDNDSKDDDDDDPDEDPDLPQHALT